MFASSGWLQPELALENSPPENLPRNLWKAKEIHDPEPSPKDQIPADQRSYYSPPDASFRLFMGEVSQRLAVPGNGDCGNVAERG